MNMFKVNTLLRLSNVHQTIKLSAEKSSLQQRLLSGIIEAFILTKENKGTGMERWKPELNWLGEGLPLWVCMWPDAQEISAPLHANMCRSHRVITKPWTWSTTAIESESDRARVLGHPFLPIIDVFLLQVCVYSRSVVAPHVDVHGCVLAD